jgi:hypothetical protein
MTATFQSLRDTRLPKAEKAVSLLQNLVRYEHTEQEAKDLVNAISDAVDDVDARFAHKWGWQDEEDTPRDHISGFTGTAEELRDAFREVYPETYALFAALPETNEEDVAYLADLRERIRGIAVCHGVDGYDVDKLREMIVRFQQHQKKATDIPSGTADGGADFEAEVRWAYDALKRNDKKLAMDRLQRILNGEKT